MNVPASPGVFNAVTTVKYSGTSTVRLSTATAAVSHQLMLWSLRIFSGLPEDAAVFAATVALVMIASPYSLRPFPCR